MRRQLAPLVNVLPREQQEVGLEHGLDPLLAKPLADGAAVFVVNHAARLVENLPTALPGHVSQVGVFQVEGRQQPVEAAQTQKFSAVEGAGAAAAVEARKEAVHGIVDAVAHPQAAILPPALGEPGFLAHPGGIAEKNLAGDGEDQRIVEAFQQRRKETRVHPHVAVQQHHDIVPGGAKARVRAAAETQVRGQGEEFHLWKRGADEIGAAIGAAVVHHDDLVFRIAGSGGGDRGQVLFQQLPAVPVGDDDGGGGGPRPLALLRCARPPAPVERTPENVGGGQRQRA